MEPEIKTAEYYAKKYRRLLQEIVKQVHAGEKMNLVYLVGMMQGVDLDLSDIVSDPAPWTWTQDALLDAWIAGEVSEGYVAGILNISRIQARVLRENREVKRKLGEVLGITIVLDTDLPPGTVKMEYRDDGD